MSVDFGSAPRTGIMRPPEIFGQDVLPHAGDPQGLRPPEGPLRQ